MDKIGFFFIFSLIKLIALAIAVKKYTNIIGKGVSDEEKKVIVDFHNMLRLEILQGHVPNQPKATKMKRLRWDTQLARKAQHVADRMVAEHEEVEDDRWDHVGQNIVESYENLYKHGADWCWVLTIWLEEVNVYDYNEPLSNPTNNYTQMVWADTTHIGCAYTYYIEPGSPNKFRKLYVCNYGPGGNIADQKPYNINECICSYFCRIRRTISKEQNRWKKQISLKK